MQAVFADSVYWIALANPRDQWHQAVRDASRQLANRRIVTTEEVLTEFLNHYSKGGESARNVAVRTVRKLIANPNVEILPQNRDTFLRGLDHYEQRSDKGYSLTDCISMVRMRESGLTEILTSDKHFRQEGFSPLLPEVDE